MLLDDPFLAEFSKQYNSEGPLAIMIQENPFPIWQSLVLCLQSMIGAPRRPKLESSGWGCVQRQPMQVGSFSPGHRVGEWIFTALLSLWTLPSCWRSSNLSAAVIYSLLLFIAELTSEQLSSPIALETWLKAGRNVGAFLSCFSL